MGSSCLHAFGRANLAALLAFGLCSSVGNAQTDDGVVFVGDANPASASARGPKLPTLSAPLRGGDPRYLPKALTQPRNSAMAGRAPGGGATQADYARAVSQRIRQAEAEQGKKKSFLGRFFSGRDRADQPKRLASPEPAPSLPVGLTRERAGAVQQAAFVSENARRGTVGSSVGARNRSGLFNFGSKPSQKRSNSNKKHVARTRRTPAAPKPLAAAPDAKRLTTEPVDDGIVFVGDEPLPPSGLPMHSASDLAEQKPEKKLPRPTIAPRAVRPSTRLTAQTGGHSRPLIKAVEPAPLPVDRPAKKQTKKQPAAVASNPAPAAKKVVTKPAPAEPAAKRRRYLISGAGSPTPQQKPQPMPQTRRPAPANPVPAAVAVKTPSKRAIALLVEANKYAQQAKTEQEFTQIVQRCRHVLAIDDSDAVIKYSNQLASWALNKRGEARADSGRQEEAITDFADSLQMDPTRWRAIHNRGVVLAQAGNFAEAFDAFSDTLDINPNFAKAYSNRASLYVQAGEFEKAMEDFATAIAIDPDLAIAHKGRGRVCHMLGLLEQAIRHFDAATMLSPQDAEAATSRADLLVDMGRYASAQDAYAQALRLDPTRPSAYRNLAWLQATCPDERFLDAEAAVANAQKALELIGAEDDISLDTLAAALAAAGDFENARAVIRRAIEIAPDGDQQVYQERLSLYEAGEQFFSAPVAAAVRQAGFQQPMQ